MTSWERGEDYAKKVEAELMDQIKQGDAPWQKPWKPVELPAVATFTTSKKHTGEDGPRHIETEEADG